AARPPAPPDLPGSSDLVAHMQACGNDLERPATRLLPAIAEIKRALGAQAGCSLAAMSGSGPTCFGVFAGEAQARRAAEEIAAAHDGWWVKAALLQGSPAA
ncbi:MAG: 4-(cytidine 5'-diphospho)-2-C-methyl-D-erythritol kinase, partial [Hyphomonadaceae bacterium]|nr:4-(cytidine 5'-diphospho)-2-C-methyl-D-erythritol kinase [Hyphomonadaceae bacterium]